MGQLREICIFTVRYKALFIAEINACAKTYGPVTGLSDTFFLDVAIVAHVVVAIWAQDALLCRTGLQVMPVLRYASFGIWACVFWPWD